MWLYALPTLTGIIGVAMGAWSWNHCNRAGKRTDSSVSALLVGSSLAIASGIMWLLKSVY